MVEKSSRNNELPSVHHVTPIFLKETVASFKSAGEGRECRKGGKGVQKGSGEGEGRGCRGEGREGSAEGRECRGKGMQMKRKGVEDTLSADST